jgi:hypothetical protein
MLRSDDDTSYIRFSWLARNWVCELCVWLTEMGGRDEGMWPDGIILLIDTG